MKRPQPGWRERLRQLREEVGREIEIIRGAAEALAELGTGVDRLIEAEELEAARLADLAACRAGEILVALEDLAGVPTRRQLAEWLDQLAQERRESGEAEGKPTFEGKAPWWSERDG